MLSLRNLDKRFDAALAAVTDLSLDVADGEIIALIGPSGCGKTTTLRMIAGFETPDSGTIHLNGRDIGKLAPERRQIGMVFQDYALFPHMTVAENILFGARDATDLPTVLAMVGLSGMEARYPDQMSGGQQQRVALARTLASHPRLILLDEPFSNLDPSLRASTRREIRRMLKDAGRAVVMVTHDQEEALSFADRVAVMEAGRLVQIGTAQDVYDLPATAFVAGFLGRTNLVDGVADGLLCETPLGALQLAHPATGRVQLSLRPEHVRLHPSDAADSGVIVAVDYKGHDVTYWIDWRGMDLQVDAMNGPRLQEGDRVTPKITGPAVALSPPSS